MGTRPEIIKMQPILDLIKKRNHDLIFVHTGQHYDFMMSDFFINELKIPIPDYFLRVNTKSQAKQISEIISKSEDLLSKENPDLVVVLGDTNSALAAALSAGKLGCPVGHIEAGCRSYVKSMPEEFNRVLLSDIAYQNYAPTQNCFSNLIREGINEDSIFLTGHPLVDLLSNIKIDDSNRDLNNLGIYLKEYYFLTLHRRENIEEYDNLVKILIAIDDISSQIPIIFPCHPHTKNQISIFGLEKYLQNIKVIDTVGYYQSLSLIKNAKLVLTDSGGIQQEAQILKTPCLTLRHVTEWVETIKAGVNFLINRNYTDILERIQNIEENYASIIGNFGRSERLFGEVGASQRILDIIETKF